MKDLASHIMDIVQNSIRAEANSIKIKVVEDTNKDTFNIAISDNGCGMVEDTLNRVRDPFFTSRAVRKVGLGIPLLQQNAERTEGKLTISSQKGIGTTVSAFFLHNHPDRPPLGDVATIIGLLAVANPKIHFIYEHTTNYGKYIFDTEEVSKILDGVPLSHSDIIFALEEMIDENLREIKVDQNNLITTK